MVSRRRSTPWIHRWSRLLIAAIALIGVLGTAYLTIVSLSGGSAACPTKGCDQVLKSAYAKLFGIPLSAFGLTAYLTMGTLAIGPLLVNPQTQKELRQTLEEWSWLFLFMGATAMATFSGYLMYILSTEIKAACTYCIASACFSATLFLLSIVGREWEDVGQLVFTGMIVGVITLTGTLGVYANVNQPQDLTASPTAIPSPQEPGVPPPATTTSGPSEIALAKHLTEIGTKNYGAYWCPHCYDQKQLFGGEAFKLINYIECAPDGKDARPEECQATGLRGFPAWVINGKLYEGTQSLETLANLSGYQGPREFKNQIAGPAQ